MQPHRSNTINLQHRTGSNFKNLGLHKTKFCTHIKSNSVFTDWPYVNNMMREVLCKELRDEAQEFDYSFIVSGILPYYFHTTVRSSWVITPEVLIRECHRPDYTIFKIKTDPYKCDIRAVVEVKSKKGQSWHWLLDQMRDQANVARDDNTEKVWAIGVKGFEICVFLFELGTYLKQKPSCFDNLEPLNLNNFNTVQLDNLGVNYELCDDNGFARIALIKWKLNEPAHQPFINQMLQYTASRPA